MKKYILASLISFLPISTFSIAEENFGIGIGLGYQQKPYAGDDAEWIPIPHFKYTNGNFFIQGLKAGFFLYNSESTKFDIHAHYESLSFKPGDADGALRGLDRRRSTVELGIGVKHTFENNVFISSEFNVDILSRSKGFNLDTGVGINHAFNDHFKIIPKAGVVWSNEKHNDYYYGVSSAETLRTGISQYNPDSSFTPYIGFNSVVNATDNLSIFGGAKIKFMPNEIKNSPMTNRSTLTGFSLGINYNF